MQVCIFEGNNVERLEPLIYTRPVYDLVCGINSLRNKILRSYPGVKYSLHCRNYIEDLVKFQNPDIDVNKINGDSCLFINGQIIAPSNLQEMIPLSGKEIVYKCSGMIAAARLSGKKLEQVKQNPDFLSDESVFDGLPEENIDIKFAEYIWNLVEHNGAELRNDFELSVNGKRKDNLRGKIFDGAHLVEKDNIYIEEGSVIKPGAVIDASNGPVFIDRNATVSPNAVVEGAVYLGENSIIKSLSMIYQNVSIAHTCKVGGEVEDSIILPFTNKQHPGFLGHAYMGSWINIGADTNNSDLKNNYSTISVYNNGKMVDTKMQFLGLIMGDHTKTAINTMFNTGTVVGFSCNIFGAGFPDKYIPSFSWGGIEKMITYKASKSVEIAKRVYKRRNKELSEPEEKLFEKIFDLTKEERSKRGFRE